MLDFGRNNLFTHFDFSELLILREKRFADFFLAIGVPVKFTTFEKTIKKHTGELHKSMMQLKSESPSRK